MQNTMLDSTISNSLQLFTDKGFKIRVIMRCSEPWFVAKDVAECIEHSNVSKMCELCRDKDIAIVNGKEYSNDLLEYSESRGNPNLTVISESGLYRILAKCNLPKCEPFENWVFDEVLPSIRKTGSYSVQPTLAIPKTLPEALRAYADEVERREAAEKRAITAESERDEAIRTKAQIGSQREATAMATASAKARECEKLREQIGDSKTYKAAKAIPWLSEYFNTRNRGLYNALAHKLKKIEAGMASEFAHIMIADSQYDEIKAYHVAVIEKLHEMVQADEEFMKDYRKDVSPKTKNA